MKIKAYRCLFCTHEDTLGYSFSIHMHDRHNFQIEDLTMLATFLCDKIPMFQRLAFCTKCAMRMTRIYDMKTHKQDCTDIKPYAYKSGTFWRLNRDTLNELQRLFGPEIEKLQNGEEFIRPLPIGYVHNPGRGRGKKMDDDKTQATLAKIKDLKIESEDEDVEKFMTRHVRRTEDFLPHQFDDVDNDDDPWSNTEDWDKPDDTSSENSANTIIDRRQQHTQDTGRPETSAGFDTDNSVAWETLDPNNSMNNTTTPMTSRQMAPPNTPATTQPITSPPLALGMMKLDYLPATNPFQAKFGKPDLVKSPPTSQPPREPMTMPQSMDWNKYTPPDPEELNRQPTNMTHRQDYEDMITGLAYVPSTIGELRQRRSTLRPCRQQWLFEQTLTPGQYSIKGNFPRVRLVVTKHWLNPIPTEPEMNVDIDKDEMMMNLTDMTTRPPMNLLIASLASYVPAGEHEVIPWDTAKQISRVMVLDA